MIDKFTDKYKFLSNFYLVNIEYKGHIFPSVEHAYQATKFNLSRWYIFTDPNLSPGKAKRLGKECQLTNNWLSKRIELMEQLLRLKFSNPELMVMLLATGNQPLVEGNNWGDTFWGKCNGKGRNHLGRLLMKIREDLK